ncbi:hypothetical protein BTVI_54074 [Pitangus sulphuratus]|nr:hypothetical protein BTVI_54074 [Pitangus sulphuratus]
MLTLYSALLKKKTSQTALSSVCLKGIEVFPCQPTGDRISRNRLQLLDGSFLERKLIPSGVSSVGLIGVVWGPLLYTINDLDTGLEGILRKFVDETKLRGAIDSLKGREVLQRALKESENREISHQYEVQKGKLLDSACGMGQPWIMGLLHTEEHAGEERKKNDYNLHKINKAGAGDLGGK